MTVVRSALIQTFGSMRMEENVERQVALVEKLPPKTPRSPASILPNPRWEPAA